METSGPCPDKITDPGVGSCWADGNLQLEGSCRTEGVWFCQQAMASLPCARSPLPFTPSCAAWRLTLISLITTAACRGPSSTASLWVETQTPLLPWQEPLLGLIMGRSRSPQAGNRAVKPFKKHRSWHRACTSCTASGSEPRGSLGSESEAGAHLCPSGQK